MGRADAERIADQTKSAGSLEEVRQLRTSLVAFFVVTFALSWAVWGSRLAHERGLIGWQIGEPFVYFAVSLTAVAVTWVVGGRRALRAFARRLLRWRVPARWYAAALLLPALPALAALAVYRTFGGQHDVSALVPLSGALPLLLTQLALHLLTEEAGWRGFALPRLRVLLGPVTASLVLGLVWAAWHIPMFFVSGTRQTYPFSGFVVQVVAISVVMTWVFDRTGGSVVIAALFHAAMNTAWAVLNILWGDSALFWLCVGFTVALAVLVAIAQQKRPVSAPLNAAEIAGNETPRRDSNTALAGRQG